MTKQNILLPLFSPIRQNINNLKGEALQQKLKKIMKTALSTFVNNRINQAKFFTAEWVSTGRTQVSNELLDEYCQQIEIAATKEAIAAYYEANQEQINSAFYEISTEVSIEALTNFVINEFASSLSFNDGGNISYTLTAKF